MLYRLLLTAREVLGVWREVRTVKLQPGQPDKRLSFENLSFLTCASFNKMRFDLLSRPLLNAAQCVQRRRSPLLMLQRCTRRSVRRWQRVTIKGLRRGSEPAPVVSKWGTTVPQWLLIGMKFGINDLDTEPHILICCKTR